MPSTTRHITLTPEAHARWIRLIAERIVDEYLAEFRAKVDPPAPNGQDILDAQSGARGPRSVR